MKEIRELQNLIFANWEEFNKLRESADNLQKAGVITEQESADMLQKAIDSYKKK